MTKLYKFVLLLLLASWVTTELNAGKYNRTVDIGDTAPVFQKLPGIDGKSYSISDFKKPVLVVIFTCNSCPYAVDYEDRIISLAQASLAKDAQFQVVAINVNRNDEDQLPAMKERARAKKFNFPYLYDASQQSASAYGARCTPEIFVLNQERKIVYMGALDDNPNPKKVTVRHAQDAINATLSKTEITVSETVAIGCAIRYQRTRRKKRQAAQ